MNRMNTGEHEFQVEERCVTNVLPAALGSL
jgi:hypothetical protein